VPSVLRLTVSDPDRVGLIFVHYAIGAYKLVDDDERHGCVSGRAHFALYQQANGHRYSVAHGSGVEKIESAAIIAFPEWKDGLLGGFGDESGMFTNNTPIVAVARVKSVK
jgi:hypothetical protein